MADMMHKNGLSFLYSKRMEKCLENDMIYPIIGLTTNFFLSEWLAVEEAYPSSAITQCNHPP